MRICIDLDGTICETRRADENYSDVKPLKDVISSIQKYKEDGHEIIIYTSRHMKTCNNNIGKIIALQSKVVIEWLTKHQIPFDEINFGKPLADLYIDDKGIKFEDWNTVNKKIK